ncbi:MAG: N-6 DNA methylase [bacterium]
MRTTSLYDRELIESLINRDGIETTWRALLRTRVETAGENFAYILTKNELRGNHSAPFDVLRHLSIGEISVLYEYSLAYCNRASRKDEGQYFTPDDVSYFLAKHANNFPYSTVWIDPCSGVGNLSYWLVHEQKNPEQFLLNKLYLVDTDPLALLIARVLFTLEFQKKERGLFEKLESRFLNRDFLTTQDLPSVDAAILNPPYVSGVHNDTFETALTRNTYAYFLERVTTLCREGYISITPQTFTNATRFSSLRRILIAGHRSLDVYCFDNVPDNIFSGVKFGSGNTNKANSTRAGVIVARKAPNYTHRITPLLRWRSHERDQMLALAHTFLTETSFTKEIFPKVSKELQPLYNSVLSFDKLQQLVVTNPTSYQLQVPTTPRYFISANKQPVHRTSFKTLYFESKEDIDRAYIVLNSSYMYWWWRVNDGGMTISEKTLLDLPIPRFDPILAQRLVKKLEQSELTSKVMKMNAGKATENIKHSSELVQSLTAFLFPNYAVDLGATHANSHLNILESSPQLKLSF